MSLIKAKPIIAAFSLMICGIAIYFALFNSPDSHYVLSGTTVSGTISPKEKSFSGDGKIVFDNGDTYTGNFENGYFDGRGSFTAKNGWSYEGMFKNGMPDGEGILITEFGDTYTGQFKNGVFQVP